MLGVGRVLLVLLAGIPVCRADGASGNVYSSYYEADGDSESADFYDSYNDEITRPPPRTTVMEAHTRLKRNDLEEIRTLDPGEIIDVKGVLNNILQGKKRGVPMVQPARDYTDSYEYVENSQYFRPDDKSGIASEFKKWLPTVEDRRRSPADDKQENLAESSRQGSQESQLASRDWTFVPQPETSTYSKTDIIAEVRKMMPAGVVPKRSAEGTVQSWQPAQEDQTFGTTANTEETEQTIDIYPQETTVYSNSFMKAAVNKLVENWGPETKIVDLYPIQETSTYSNIEMQAEVKKLLKHWGPNNQQESTFNDAAVRADVRSLVQHWTPSSEGGAPSLTTLVQDWNPDMSQKESTFNDAAMRAEVRSLVQHWTPSSEGGAPSLTTLVQDWNLEMSQKESTFNDAALRAEVRSLVQHWTPTSEGGDPSLLTTLAQHRNPKMSKTPNSKESEIQQQKSKVQSKPEGSMSDLTSSITSEGQQWNPADIVQQRDHFQNLRPSEKENVTKEEKKEGVITSPSGKEEVRTLGEERPAVKIQYWSRTGSAEEWKSIVAEDGETTLDTDVSTVAVRQGDPPQETTTQAAQQAENQAAAETTTTTTTTTTTMRMDIDAIMAIISNLTYDYEWNLTEQFNKSIIEHGVPTCTGPWGPGGIWTATEEVNASSYQAKDFENGSVVSKCFVCGLTTPEIPRNAYCADAFAGDFLPLMPIDARSRSMIANYRKYCKYFDVQNYVENPEEPRAIYGRFTGGCAVRWTDITGVYTQRTCRSRYRPLLGKHFASKRMAKLELALVNVENGCIISPMATLLPVSRGVSLYARFHACVCNSNWCNRATLKHTSFDTVLIILMAHWYSRYS